MPRIRPEIHVQSVQNQSNNNSGCLGDGAPCTRSAECCYGACGTTNTTSTTLHCCARRRAEFCNADNSYHCYTHDRLKGERCCIDAECAFGRCEGHMGTFQHGTCNDYQPGFPTDIIPSQDVGESCNSKWECLNNVCGHASMDPPDNASICCPSGIAVSCPSDGRLYCTDSVGSGAECCLSSQCQVGWCVSTPLSQYGLCGIGGAPFSMS